MNRESELLRRRVITTTTHAIADYTIHMIIHNHEHPAHRFFPRSQGSLQESASRQMHRVPVYATGAHDADDGAVSPAGVSRGKHATRGGFQTARTHKFIYCKVRLRTVGQGRDVLRHQVGLGNLATRNLPIETAKYSKEVFLGKNSNSGPVWSSSTKKKSMRTDADRIPPCSTARGPSRA